MVRVQFKVLVSAMCALALVACPASTDGGSGDDDSSTTTQGTTTGGVDVSDDATGRATGAATEGTTATGETTGETTVTGDTTGQPGDVIPVSKPSEWITDVSRVPRGLHSTWEEDPSTSVTFMWTTTDLDTEAYVPKVWMVPEAELQDGKMAYRDDWVHEGWGFTYKQSIAGIDVTDEEFVIWSVQVTGLDPKTRYRYRVGTWDTFDKASASFSGQSLSQFWAFDTGHEKGDRSEYSFVMAGDSRGGTSDIVKNMPWIQKLDVNMWFFNGDMTNGGSQPEWDSWFAAMQPVLGRRVLMPVQGNHEIFHDLYYNQFALPIGTEELPEELIEHAWSVDYGNVHFIGLDSNTEALVEEQLAWLEADLAAASTDPDIDWIIAMMHHAPYSACTVHGSTPRVQEHFVPLFDAYGVDMVFAGHDHNYERSVPIRNGQKTTQDDGTVYVVAGSFFAPGYTNGNKWWTAVSFHGDIGNLVVMRVDGNTLELTAWPGNGGPEKPGSQPLDTYTLTKE